MTTDDLSRQAEAEHLAHGKRMIETTLEGWDLLTWNELLAKDVVLSLKLGAVNVGRLGRLLASGGDVEISGREQAKDVLTAIYSDLRNDLTITTQLVSGYEAILLGNLAMAKPDQELESLPVGVFLAFNLHGRIREMAIAVVDLQAAADAIRSAARRALPALQGAAITSRVTGT